VVIPSTSERERAKLAREALRELKEPVSKEKR
jgi:hypothetical protein